jgi:membrane-associated protein
MDWLQLAESLISSPWLYLILIGISVLDAFLPVVPSEPVIIMAGVYAALGQTNLVLIVLSVALGVVLGDMVPDLVGRLFGPRLLRRLPAGTKRRAAHDWVARQLETRGGFFLISTRFLPARFLPTLSAAWSGTRSARTCSTRSSPGLPGVSTARSPGMSAARSSRTTNCWPSESGSAWRWC